MKKDALQLEDLKVSNLPELQGWKEKQQKLVEDNPYVEIVDNKSYEVACKSRTALLKGRTELEKQDKLIASKLTSFRKEVKQETDNLIAITLPYEEKQQSEVKRYEEIKAAEKAEEKRLEQLRVDTIKSKINNFESASYGVIQDTTIENIDLHKSMLDAFANADFDYEEFDILFEQAKARIQTSWDAKCADIQEKEAQRIENERLQKEAEESKRISELQTTRLNQIKPYLAYCLDVDLTQLSEFGEFDFNDLLAEKKSLHDADVVAKQEADAKIEADKQKIFEIRKSRLEEIGMHDKGIGFLYFTANTNFNVPEYSISLDTVLNSDVIEFENILSYAKTAIEKSKEQAEKAEQQRLADEKLAKEDTERLKKENKAREKRLVKDKKSLTDFVKSLEFRNPVPELENEELQHILDKILLELENTRGFLLTEVNLF